MYMHMYICLYVFIRTYVRHKCVCVCVCVCACVRACMHTCVFEAPSMLFANIDVTHLHIFGDSLRKMFFFFLCKDSV